MWTFSCLWPIFSARPVTYPGLWLISSLYNRGYSRTYFSQHHARRWLISVIQRELFFLTSDFVTSALPDFLLKVAQEKTKKRLFIPHWGSNAKVKKWPTFKNQVLRDTLWISKRKSSVQMAISPYDVNAWMLSNRVSYNNPGAPCLR